MDKQTIHRRLGDIEYEMSKISNDIFALKLTDMARYPENYQKLSMEAAMRLERSTCRLRNLIFAADITSKDGYMRQAADAHGIRIGRADGILHIRLPGMLPRRRRHSSTAFLNDPLHYALMEYKRGHDFPLYAGCVICFILVYDRTLPSRRICDYDNMEFKQVLDTISPFALRDDGGRFCDTYHTTELGEDDHTDILIMCREAFPGWLKSRGNDTETMSDNF